MKTKDKNIQHTGFRRNGEARQEMMAQEYRKEGTVQHYPKESTPQHYLQFSSSWEEEYPKGEVVGKINTYERMISLPRALYHPALWAPLLPGGGESSYYCRMGASRGAVSS